MKFWSSSLSSLVGFSDILHVSEIDGGSPIDGDLRFYPRSRGTLKIDIHVSTAIFKISADARFLHIRWLQILKCDIFTRVYASTII